MNNIKKGMLVLSIGALGVVFGDIGTSPLYALSAVFGKIGYDLRINSTNVDGIISLVIWIVTLVVSIKFIGFIMRADNEGEGGVIALVTKIKDTKLKPNYKWFFILIGLAGVGLFYGDSTITPAISVLSAVQGLNVIAPNLSSYIVPLTVIILAGLFGLQRYGTGFIGRLFGPIMLLWFLAIAAGGAWQIMRHPSILIALSPYTAIHFFIVQPKLAFLAMGAVVLAITGVEALYADLGHFGRPPIARAWFYVVFPALTLCYMGEGSLLLHDHGATSNPLILMYPAVVQIPIVILATFATIIASQAVISSAFSLTRQAIQLNFLPKMLIKHTSTIKSGQIYLPFVNISLFIIVILLVIGFGSSARLANAYGIAVSGTLLTDTILYLVVVRNVWHKPLWHNILIGMAFLPIDLLFVSSNLPKIFRGGWLPILIGFLIFIMIHTWIKGQRIVDHERRQLESPLANFIEMIDNQQPPITRIPGVAVYVGHHNDLTPLALMDTFKDLHELQTKVIIVTVGVINSAHIPENKRANIQNLGRSEGICHIELTYGFHDSINIPEILKYIGKHSSELDYDYDNASYFISLNRVMITRRKNIAKWRKYIYNFMSRNALSTSDFYKLPIGRTVEMSSLIKL